MDCSMPGFPVHHQLLELAQTHVHQVSDAIQPSHLSSLFPFWSSRSVIQFSSVHSLSPVRLFVTPWTAVCQASLSITNSWSLFKLMSSTLVIPSNHLTLCHPLLLPSIFPSIRVFQMSRFFASGGQSIGVSASASVLPMNIQD